MSVFDDLTFCVSGKFSKSQQEMKDLITDNGGTVASTVNNSVNYLVASETGTGKAKDAEKKGTPIVSEDWVDKAIDSGKIPTDKSLYLSGGPGAGSSAMDDSSDSKPAKKTEKKAEKKAPARGKKRKAAGDDEEADDGGDDDSSSSSAGGKVFAGLTFCVSGKLNRPQATTEGLIRKNGGGVAQSVTKAVTHVLAANADTGKAAKAAEKGLPIVTDEWLDKSIADGKLSTDPAHFLSQPDGGSSSGSSDKKMADDEEDGDDEPPKKKQKTAAKAKSKAKAKGKGKSKAKADDDAGDDDAGDSKDTKADDKGDMDTTNDDGDKDDAADDAKKNVKTVLVKGRAPVDEISGLSKTHHVYSEGNDVYDAMLNQTNIGNNNNKFYIIQLLQADNGSGFVVWNRWGRVGANGQNARFPSNNLASAKANFTSKFYDKTRNKWENRGNFKPVSGKYTLLERDYSADDAEPAAESSGKDERKIPESKLDPRVQDVIKLIADTKMMDKQMMEVGYDAKKLPLGKLSKNHIQKGYNVLKRLSDVIEGKEDGNIQDLSNEFYTLIPHSVGMTRLSYISNMKILKEKLQMVEALADIEVALKMLKGDGSNVNLIDQHYANLKCDMVPLEKKSADLELIKAYVKNTHGTTHWQYDLEVLEAFDLRRHGENDRFKEFAKDKNRMLLWHGSRMTNFVGIISQGLRIAPPEAPVTGYMFGKGVYFADMVSKSANYCFTSRDSNVGFMLLCDVALGDMHELFQADFYADVHSKEAKCLSTKGCGRSVPDPKGFKTLSDGTVVPCGKESQAPKTVLDQTSLQYNEFIVYNVSQIRARYLVKMKFNYK